MSLQRVRQVYSSFKIYRKKKVGRQKADAAALRYKYNALESCRGTRKTNKTQRKLCQRAKPFHEANRRSWKDETTRLALMHYPAKRVYLSGMANCATIAKK